ncbi:MAG TPA: ABC transporter substrate-binding protein [Acidimicrobiales bacterium]|nr:ABC transporter substrate-binding protein [Acidimicrobiales bacterium]
MLVAGAMVMTSSSPAGASGPLYGPTGAVPSVGTEIQGGTVSVVEGPGAAPNYIFPYTNAEACGFQNFGMMFWLMYRPLYWFGNNNQPTVDYSYSVGEPPVFTNGDKTVTVTLKDWKWSDGETVSSRDVEFWMNIYNATKTTNNAYCDYTPGFFPDNVASIDYPNSSTVVFHLKQAYNPTWFLYNELSQITPIPIAWDRTSLSQPAPSQTAPNLPDTTTAGAQKVYAFLNGKATDPADWANSPLWSVVDGPWTLQAFTTTGQATFVPNPDYSGSPKPIISKLVELPVTGDQAILNLARSGPNNVQLVNVPDEFLPQLSSLEAEGYNATNFTTFSFAYFPLNLGNPTFGPVFRQLYFRQAFQHLVDQEGWVKKIFGGFAAPTYGPVPLAPPNSFYDSYETTNPYAFSVPEAVSILKANGWTDVGPGELATCDNWKLCAPGDPKAQGLQLKFNFDYQSGAVTTEEEVTDLKSQAAQAGIQLELTTHPFITVVETAIDCGPGSTAKPAQCKWTVEDWGAGWIYAPDYLPTGESLFLPGAAANYEGYSSPEATKLTLATLTDTGAAGQAALDAYQNYIEQQVPVVYIPTATGDIGSGNFVLSSKHLGGFTNNVFSNFTPETWYLTK